ncbi:MAG: hypothetical protein V4603_10110 [Pseudomonadota bacterium]
MRLHYSLVIGLLFSDVAILATAQQNTAVPLLTPSTTLQIPNAVREQLRADATSFYDKLKSYRQHLGPSLSGDSSLQAAVMEDEATRLQVELIEVEKLRNFLDQFTTSVSKQSASSLAPVCANIAKGSVPSLEEARAVVEQQDENRLLLEQAAGNSFFAEAVSELGEEIAAATQVRINEWGDSMRVTDKLNTAQSVEMAFGGDYQRYLKSICGIG